jgi:hypothetical protein
MAAFYYGGEINALSGIVGVSACRCQPRVQGPPRLARESPLSAKLGSARPLPYYHESTGFAPVKLHGFLKTSDAGLANAALVDLVMEASERSFDM